MEEKKTNKVVVFLVFLLTAAACAGFIWFKLQEVEKNKTNDDKKKSSETSKKDVVPDVTKDYKEHNGKEIIVYKYTDENGNIYTNEENDDYGKKEKAGSIKCITTTCEPADYDPFSNKYALIDEKDGTISLYDYTKNILVYNSKKEITSPLPDDFYEDRFGLILDDDNNAYGYYNEYSKNSTWYTNIYSLLSNKYYSEIVGVAGTTARIYQTHKIIDKKYYPITQNYKYNDEVKNSYDILIDLSTGKKVITLNGLVSDVIEFKNNSYIVLGREVSAENDVSTNITDIIDIKGNTKFKNIELRYNDNNQLVFSKDNKFYVYDSNLKLQKESKTYTKILGIYKDYILVKEGTKVELVDYKDNWVTTLFTENSNMVIHTGLSGWYTANDKNGIYVVVSDKATTYAEVKKDNPETTYEDYTTADNGAGYEYYYIPSTKETGKIAVLIGGYAKPVLYLYPTKKTNVTVNFEHEDMLTTTYPKFNKEWSVTASPNGDLYDKNGKYYYALYWEENGNHRVDFSEGFYVEKENAIEFLEEKLEYIGLNKKERNEFIMYWLPILEKNKKNLVYFELTEERDSYNKLKINPQPDSLLRVAIHVKKVNKKTSIKEEKLTKFNRTGFSAVEWGGVEY